MKKDYLRNQILILMNQAIVLLFFLFLVKTNSDVTRFNLFQLSLVSIMSADGAYITYKNVKGNTVLTEFAALLVITSWQFMAGFAADDNMIEKIYLIEQLCCEPARQGMHYGMLEGVYTTLIVICFYQSVRFILTFFFQDIAYLYKKQIQAVLKAACLLSVICNFISQALFALAFMGQVIVSGICVFMLGIIHREQLKFFLKSQGRKLLVSAVCVLPPFAAYIALFHGRPDYLDNLLSYFLIMLSFVSIHSIIWKSRTFRGREMTLNWKGKAVLLASGVLTAAGILAISGVSFVFVIILFHAGLILVLMYNILIYVQYSRSTEGVNGLKQNHFYSYALEQMKQEEELKKEFSNYLHDNILQDLLSIKNMMKKADRPDVKNIISETLESLNTSIRTEMAEYHPVLLKSLTMKENIENLLNDIEKSYPDVNCQLLLDCDDKLFLIYPYQMIVYRMVRELTANAMKHSEASQVRVILIQEKGIIRLSVADNGKGMKADQTHMGSHKGLSSIYEQTLMLDGYIDIKKNGPGGTRIDIEMPMKGEESYESFIG